MKYLPPHSFAISDVIGTLLKAHNIEVVRNIRVEKNGKYHEQKTVNICSKTFSR